MSKPILALIGSTASGKSEIALRVAQQYGAAILSCDSLLVYKDLTIGTAKPSAQEMIEIPHYGINLVSPIENYTAGDYVRYARKVLDDLVAKNKPVIIVGGTGFYLKALLCGTWDAPPTQLDLRAQLESKSNEELYELLQKKDPDHAKKIKLQDKYRIVRALEIMEVTGSTITDIQAKQTLQNPLPYPTKILGLKRTPMELERRIIDRTNWMFSQGLVEETKKILKQYSIPYTESSTINLPRSLQCVGYYEVLQFLQGKMTLQECRERIVISTRQLAKKQRTFFKTFPIPIDWFTLPSQEEELLDTIRRTW